MTFERLDVKKSIATSHGRQFICNMKTTS